MTEDRERAEYEKLSNAAVAVVRVLTKEISEQVEAARCEERKRTLEECAKIVENTPLFWIGGAVERELAFFLAQQMRPEALEHAMKLLIATREEVWRAARTSSPLPRPKK